MKRLFAPAFNDINRQLSMRICFIGLLLILFFAIPYPTNVIIYFDPPRSAAITDAKLREVAWKRMEEACFTDEQITDYWYDQGFWEHPNRLLVVIKGREALCGGRRLCGCEGKERVPDSV